MTPHVNHVLETVIYGLDLAAMERFYCDVIGRRKISDAGPRAFALRVSPQNVLLIFDPRQTRLPHGTVPQHGAEGGGHVAISIDHEQLEVWREHLSRAGVVTPRQSQCTDARANDHLRGWSSRHPSRGGQLRPRCRRRR